MPISVQQALQTVRRQNRLIDRDEKERGEARKEFGSYRDRLSTMSPNVIVGRANLLAKLADKGDKRARRQYLAIQDLAEQYQPMITKIEQGDTEAKEQFLTPNERFDSTNKAEDILLGANKVVKEAPKMLVEAPLRLYRALDYAEEERELNKKLQKGEITYDEYKRVVDPMAEKAEFKISDKGGEIARKVGADVAGTALDILTLKAGAVAKGATRAAKIAQGARTGSKLGATYGAISGLREDDPTLKGIGTSALIGAGAGAVLGGGTAGISDIVSSKLGRKTQELAEGTAQTGRNVIRQPRGLPAPGESTFSDDLETQIRQVDEVIASVNKGERTLPAQDLRAMLRYKNRLQNELANPSKQVTDTPVIGSPSEGGIVRDITPETPQPTVRPTVTAQTDDGVQVKMAAPASEQPTTGLIPQLKEALDQIPTLNAKQAKQLSKERGQRIGKAVAASEGKSGESALSARLGALKGDYGEFTMSPLDGVLPESTITQIGDNLLNSPRMRPFEQTNATQAWYAMVREGRVPRPYERELLKRELGEEVLAKLDEKLPTLERGKNLALEIANLPRVAMTPLDASITLRQNLFTNLSHPIKIGLPNLGRAVRAYSPKYFEELQSTMPRRYGQRYYDAFKKWGGDLTEVGGRNIATGEEQFIGSRLAEKVPVAGGAIKASNRSAVAASNEARLGLFKIMAQDAERMGIDILDEANADMMKGIIKVAHVGTGRGDLKKMFRGAANVLNATIFSPKLAASRLTVLYPPYYIKLPPVARKEALRQLAALTSFTGAVLYAAKQAGASVQLDPRNADFAKVRIGDTRIDIAGGIQQYLRLGAQVISGKVISSTTGKEILLGDETAYKPMTRADIISRFFESKSAPVASFVIDAVRGEDFIGNDFKLQNAIAQRFTPMILQDASDLFKEDPRMLPLSGLAFFGFGTQTYGSPRERYEQKFGSIQNSNRSRVEQELDRISKQSDEHYYPGKPSKEQNKKKLSDEEYERFRDTYGRKFTYQLAQELDRQEFNSMDVNEQAKIVERLVRRTREEARNELGI